MEIHMKEKPIAPALNYMRTVLVILYTLGIINCFSQDFTGQIVYKTRIVAKRENINTDSILDATSGDSAIYYISGSRYKCTFFRKGKERYEYIYHHSNFKFYFLYPGIEYITWSDSRKTHDVIRDLKIFRDSTTTILGYPCYTTKKAYDNYISTAYYSDSIKVNPETFRGHNAADWYNELKRTGGSFNIKTVSEYKDYLEITEAILILPMLVNDDLFKLPKGRPVVASAHALDKAVSMTQTKNTPLCYKFNSAKLQTANPDMETLRCMIALVVTADGGITHIRALQEDKYGAFRVAMDIISDCEITFTPGEINGKVVDSECFIPIVFKF